MKNIFWGILKNLFEEVQKQLKASSIIYDHSNTTDHTTIVGKFSIIRMDDQSLTKAIKESIYIRVLYTSLNKNIGK